MISAFFLLLAVLVLGSVPTAGILASRYRDARRWQRDLMAYELRFPRGLNPAVVQNFISGVSGLGGGRRRAVSIRGVMFETSATRDGVRHHLLVPHDARDVVLAGLRATLPGVVVTPDETYKPARARAAVELGLSSHRRPLRIGDPAVTSAHILANLQPLSETERIVTQWYVSPVGPAEGAGQVAGTGMMRQFLGHLWSGFLMEKKDSTDMLAAHKVKHAHPVFVAVPRIGAEAASAGRARQLVAQCVSPFRAVSAPGVHFFRRGLPEHLIRDGVREHRPVVLAYPSVLNAAELTALLAFPMGSVSLPGLRLAGSRQLAPANDIPAGGRIVATATFPGAERPLALGVSDSLRHLHVMGPTGVGKSTLLLGLIAQDMAAGRGVVVIDPKGDLVADVLDRVPEERVGDVVVLDPTDEERPVGLNLLAGAHRDPELVSDQLVGILHKLYASSWGPRTADIMRASLLTLATMPGTTLVEVPLLLTNPGFRRRLVARVDDPIALGPFWGWYDGLSEGERGAAIGPVMNKLRAFILSKRLRNVLGQVEPRFYLERALATRKIVLVPLAKGLLGEEAAALIGSLVVAKVWQAVMRRVDLPADRRPTTMMVVDEFQDYLNLPTGIADILAQARGLGLGLTLAHQHLGQLPSGIREAVLANARSRIMFQLGGSDARTLAKDLAPHLTADDLMGLGAYEIVATLSAGARVAPPVTGRTLPPPPVTGQA